MIDIVEKIRTDKEMYYGYQANIAMAFYDECRRQKDKKRYMSNVDIHKAANKAAKNFLNLLTR